MDLEERGYEMKVVFNCLRIRINGILMKTLTYFMFAEKAGNLFIR
jgi:hypothetical protein